MFLPLSHRLRWFVQVTLAVAAVLAGIAFGIRVATNAIEDAKTVERGKMLTTINKAFDAQAEKAAESIADPNMIGCSLRGMEGYRSDLCTRHVYLLWAALVAYARAHDGRLPEREANDMSGQESWIPALFPYLQALCAKEADAQRRELEADRKGSSQAYFFDDPTTILCHPGVRVKDEPVSYEFNPLLYGCTLDSLKNRSDFFLREREACTGIGADRGRSYDNHEIPVEYGLAILSGKRIRLTAQIRELVSPAATIPPVNIRVDHYVLMKVCFWETLAGCLAIAGLVVGIAVKGRQTRHFRWHGEGAVCLGIFVGLFSLVWSSSLSLQNATMIRSHRLMYWQHYLAQPSPHK